MEILKRRTNIDFISKRRPALFISSVVNLAILVGVALTGLNWGIDFAGGTVVELKFNHPIKAAEVRHRAEQGGLKDVSVQGIGPTEEGAFLVKLGGTTQLTKETAAQAEQEIRKLGEVKSITPDLDNGLISFRTAQKVDSQKVREAVQPLVGVKEVREVGEVGGAHEYQVVAMGMAEKVTAAIAGANAPDFEIRRTEYVGPQVGKQLRNKGVGALIYAMLAILVYVAFRFDFRFAPGAILAMIHDAIMVLGFYWIAGLVAHREFTLTSIAALLTVIGYSVNDTIVIYDRIREEMVRYKGKPLPEIINIAVNDTLSRTILTGGVTALSLVGLLIFGVGEIWDFAMAMLVGILVGTYSSIYIASPLTIWLDERAAAKAKRSPQKDGGPQRIAASR